MSSLFSASVLLEQVRLGLQQALATRISAGPAAGAAQQTWQLGASACFSVVALPLVADTTWTGALDRLTQSGPPLLVVAERISQQARTHLRARGICYADAAGNAWLRHAAGLLVALRGYQQAAPAPAAAPMPTAPTTAPPARLNVAGMRLVFHLLRTPALVACPVREIAKTTRFSPSVVVRTLAYLEEHALWSADPAGWVALRPAVVEHWVGYYASTLRNRLNPQRYRWLTAAPPDWPYPLPPGCVWSGEAAAQRLLGISADPPPLLTIYSTLPRAQLAHHLQLVPCQRGPVELLNPYFSPFLPDPEQCAPPLVVYADLLASPAPRTAALAQQIRQAGLW
ncbi:type IV toxin-antitoxin system AbiEi family antitoxin [Hymenobacter profundi]|uniref:HTH iclR-type domain-containing protein n=1 Tax=Hymenobacter profundi TaxID=1982110 RepID=A0ABS6WXW9_9BACT|nr:type IV toxin-antitoxin system AbiEi family antitoxin [Hymenobacter profundi]MBW3128442.1 hypothetical protein [Hymenobacter profundi]